MWLTEIQDSIVCTVPPRSYDVAACVRPFVRQFAPGHASSRCCARQGEKGSLRRLAALFLLTHIAHIELGALASVLLSAFAVLVACCSRCSQRLLLLLFPFAHVASCCCCSRCSRMLRLAVVALVARACWLSSFAGYITACHPSFRHALCSLQLGGCRFDAGPRRCSNAGPRRRSEEPTRHHASRKAETRQIEQCSIRYDEVA